MAKKSTTTTFLVELPLVVEPGPAKRVRAHLEAARQFYNVVPSEWLHLLPRMQADPGWQESHHYRVTPRRLATLERKLAAHRKSLHGCLVNELARVGNHLQIEKTSFKGWQRGYGKSVTRACVSLRGLPTGSVGAGARTPAAWARGDSEMVR